MSNYQQASNKPNTGALFKNEQKKVENSPDYMGRVNINGHEMYLSGWIKVSQAGKTYMSLSLTEPSQSKPGQNQSQMTQSQSRTPFF